MFALALCIGPGAALAANPELPRALGLYEEMRFEEAYQTFQTALAHRNNTPGELASIYMHLGIVAAYLDRQSEAVDHFARWLCIYPDAKLADGVSPKVEQPFLEAQQRAETVSTFRLVHVPVSQLPEGGGLELEAELIPDSLGLATGLTLRYREAGKPEYASLRKDGGAVHLFAVSSTELRGGEDVDYYLQINEAHGGVLWEFGSARAPIRVRAPAGSGAVAEASGRTGDEDDGAGAAFYTQPWFFIAAGVGAAVVIGGGVTAIAIAATAEEQEYALFGTVGQDVAQAH